MPKVSLAEIAAAIRSKNSFLITSHTSPDGDAVGSMLAVYHLLRALGKKDVACVCDDPVPRIYAWVPGVAEIQRSDAYVASQPADMLIAVDAGSKARLGKAAELAGPETAWVMLDHHPEEHLAFGLWYIDPSYSAVGEIAVELFDAASLPLSREAALCAYVSIVTDTGGFRFMNTTSRSHRIAARLIDAGVDVADVASRVFDIMSIPKFDILRRVLDNTERIADGRIAHSMLTLQDLAETSAKVEDVDGLINYTRNIEGVELGVVFREIEPQKTKVSMRSKNNFDCGKFLGAFGGGGHAGAAGTTLGLSLKEARQLILERLCAELGVL